ncbi:MAG: RnfABCDGE type electron transport complex subunit D [Candidatus Aerophobetes bacterium]
MSEKKSNQKGEKSSPEKALVREKKTPAAEGKILTVAAAPHIGVARTVPDVMWGVVISLTPVIASSIYYFQWLAVKLILTCLVTSLATEAIFQLARGKRITLYDGSATISGILIAMVLPPHLPWWAAVLGSVFAIVIGKQIFGGLGYNIFNPALIGRAFLMTTFPVLMTTWTNPITLNAISGATPLGMLKFEHQMTSLYHLFTGNVSGSLGEASALAIIIGGIYLLGRGYADWRISLSYLATVVGLSGIFWLINPGYGPPSFHLLAGGLLLGAIFMATDPVTAPITKRGRWIFGVGAGVIVVIIRLWGGYAEGVMFSILLMNAITPLLNRHTIPVQLGGRKK